MKKEVLRLMRRGERILEAIEGLSENDIRVLQLIASEKMTFLDLNAMLHHQFGIDNALDIVSRLKDRELIIELLDRRP